MIAEPNCYKRKCVHFWGVYQPEGSEVAETVNCAAFPDGIPIDIAYGDDKHKKVHPLQTNKIVFKKEKRKRSNFLFT